MRKRRVAATATAAILMTAGTVSAPVAAHADSSTTFYVRGNSCSDTTTDSSTTPYCTIQAAVDAATSPGDTVLIASGAYAPFTVTASGTAAAPITIARMVDPDAVNAITVNVNAATSATALTVDGASYLTVEGLTLNGPRTVVRVTGSASHITVDGGRIQQGGTAVPGSAVQIDAGTSAVTLSRNFISSLSPDSGTVHASGSADDVFTTNLVSGSPTSPDFVLSGTTDSAITSNSVGQGCGAEAEAVSGSTGTTIENNVLTNQAATAAGCPVADASAGVVLVDASSVTGSKADYNDVYLSTTTSATIAHYLWSGTAYATAAAFTAGAGQGAHDSNTTGGTVAIDSADSAAPGELATDYLGDPRVDDPLVPDTGAGPSTFYDRGAGETRDPIAVQRSADWPTEMPLATPGTFTATVHDGWTSVGIQSCIYDFGDGSSQVTVTPSDSSCSTQHTYTVAGSYSVRLVVEAGDGVTSTITTTMTSSGVNELEPKVDLRQYDSREVVVSDTGTNSWNIVERDVDFGDGTSENVSLLQDGAAHTYTSSGTYQITITDKDSGGNVASASADFTAVGSLFNPTAPTRVLDTRKAIGVPEAAKVAAGGTVKLQLAGTHGIPADATAVTLNVTAADTAGGGYVTVYPDGTAAPTVSNLNFLAGQIVPNVVIVKLGSDGAIDLKNASTGTVDLLADLEGYYAPTGDSYAVGSSSRVIDTRASHQTLAPGATLRVNLQAPSVETAATMNVTVTNPTGGGYITAYPDGTDVPAASNLNFVAKQTVANEVVVQIGSDGYVDFKNASPGTVDLVVDYNGDFETVSDGSAFTPIAPTRFLDTRKGTGDFSAARLADGAVPAGGTGLLSIAGDGKVPGVPADAIGVAANITVTGPTEGGYITVYPSEQTQRPVGSTLNFSAGQTIANAASILMSNPGPGGIYLYNGSNGSVQLVVDVFGYYS